MRWFVVAIAVVLANPTPATASSPLTPQVGSSPAVDMVAHAEWILASQLASGAIANHTDRRFVSPYLAHFAAIGLARATAATGQPKYADAAWRWLRWYGAHQDDTGYVTDYRVGGDGRETSTRDMDSTDSYAGLFLVALLEASEVSGGLPVLYELRPHIDLAVRAIVSTQDTDGLTWSKPSFRTKYLMDQSETYVGLLAAVDMAFRVGDIDLALRAEGAARAMRAGIESLWSPGDGAYHWAKSETGSLSPQRWSQLFPDTLQQAWAVAFGITDPARSEALLSQLQRVQPDWDQPDAFAQIDNRARPAGYWPVAVWALLRAGHAAEAEESSRNIEQVARNGGFAWPYNTGVAGQLIGLPTSLAKLTLRPEPAAVTEVPDPDGEGAPVVTPGYPRAPADRPFPSVSAPSSAPSSDDDAVAAHRDASPNASSWPALLATAVAAIATVLLGLLNGLRRARRKQEA